MWTAQISQKENLEMFPLLSDLDINSNLIVQHHLDVLEQKLRQ